MSRTGIALIALACVCTALAAPPTGAQAPMRVGDHHPINIDSGGASDVEATPTATGRVYRVSHEGATYIAIHFADFDLAPGDLVRISDAGGGQDYVLSGKGKMEAGNFWSQHVKGDTVLLEYVTRGNGGKLGRGFTIDQYAAGFVDLGGPDTEAICGGDDKDNAVCYETSNPAEYDKARAVARLLIQGSALCTGWLASASNHLVTNEHCITSATAALNTDYEFGAEAASCGLNNCQLCHPGTVFSGATFVQDNAALDYALVKLNGNQAATFGFLEIDNRDAVIGEQIYIPQHPGGRAKEIGINSSHSLDSPSGLCHVNSFEPGCSSGSYQDVGYMCDTEGGSSGSPVLASSSDKVIALHHCANCENRGVPIDLVCAEICSLLGPQCTIDADCDDGDACTTDVCQPAGTCSNTPQPNCCGNGTCETGEDCISCAADCVGGTTSGAVCGNNICEAGNGEDCLSCAADCNGVQSGRPSNRYCCGDGDGTNPVFCGDSRCTAQGNTCTTVPSMPDSFCCGDAVCDSGETCSNCARDCMGVEVCGDGVDNDCDGATDCDDSDCSGDPVACPPCTTTGNSCRNDGDCCSGNCSNGPPSSRVCQ